MPTRSPRRNTRSKGRAGRTFYGTSGGGAATDPSGMSGNILWVRAKDLSAGSVTTWTDQSGAGHNLTGVGTTKPVATVTRTPGGGKAVVFGGPNTGYFTASDLATVTPTTSGDFSGGGGSAAGLTDGNPATYWASLASLPQWARLDFGSARTVQSYNIQALSSAAATPTAWTVEGSADGSTGWATLDTRSAQTGWTASELRSYTIASPAAYRYYRLTVTAASATNVGIAAWDTFTYAAAELWVVVKATGTTFQSSWQISSATGNAADAAHYQYSDGKVYETFGLTPGNRQNFTPSLATTSWRLYRVVNNGTTWQAWIDNTSQGTSSSKPVGWRTNWTIGSLTTPNGLWYWGGEIAELLVRSQVSTAGEVTNLITYFNAEHGLTVT